MRHKVGCEGVINELNNYLMFSVLYSDFVMFSYEKVCSTS